MKILIIEKKQYLYKQVNSEFTRGDDQVIQAATEFEALGLFREQRPDIIIMDAEESAIDVIEVTSRIRGNSNSDENYYDTHTPILFITSKEEYDDEERAKKAGVSDYYSRTFFTGEIKNLVRQTFKGSTPHRFKNVTVLVVDDNDTTVKLLKKVLVSEGINCLEATNGIEALEIIKREGDELDLVLTDYLMPEMDGLELCQKIREDLDSQTLPVIFLSGVSEMDFVIKIYKAGASDYLPKPFTKEELLARFKVHLESRRLNQDLKQKVVELKMHDVVKNRLMGITSHDLRSPLNGIMGISNLLLDDKSLTEDQREKVELISQSGDYLLEFITDIITLSKIYEDDELISPQKIKLNSLLASAVEHNTNAAYLKSIDLSAVSLNGSVQISSDGPSILRILNNLITNALKFTKEGGNVTLILYAPEEDKVKIEVKDTGIGIAPDFLATLFSQTQRYLRQGTNFEASTGLGLSIISELVKKLKGEISVESVEHKGTSFFLTLPLEYEA